MENKSKVVRLIITIAVTIFWMMVIFGFSGQSGAESSGLSKRVADFICGVFSLELGYESYDMLIFIIRKGAHMTEYAILGILYTSIIVQIRQSIDKKRLLAITTICCAIYAMTDEFHQSFSGGRTPAIKDVCIDTIGGLLGGAICLFILYILRKRSEKV